MSEELFKEAKKLELQRMKLYNYHPAHLNKNKNNKSYNIDANEFDLNKYSKQQRRKLRRKFVKSHEKLVTSYINEITDDKNQYNESNNIENLADDLNYSNSVHGETKSKSKKKNVSNTQNNNEGKSTHELCVSYKNLTNESIQENVESGSDNNNKIKKKNKKRKLLNIDCSNLTKDVSIQTENDICCCPRKNFSEQKKKHKNSSQKIDEVGITEDASEDLTMKKRKESETFLKNEPKKLKLIKQETNQNSNYSNAVNNLSKVNEQLRLIKKMSAGKQKAIKSEIEIKADVKNKKCSGLRPIVIDGANVGTAFWKKKNESENKVSILGIRKAVDYFIDRGHKVRVFLPQNKVNSKYLENEEYLKDMEEENIINYTPSRMINGMYVNNYDDVFIVEYAKHTGAIIVSRDKYTDLASENEEWRNLINSNLLPYMWVDDIFLVPNDPLGPHGPKLHEFLRFSKT